MSDARKFWLLIAIWFTPITAGLVLSVWGYMHMNFVAISGGLVLVLLEPIVLKIFRVAE